MNDRRTTCRRIMLGHSVTEYGVFCQAGCLSIG